MQTITQEVLREVNPVPDPDAAVDPTVRTSTLAHVLESAGNRGASAAPRRRWRLPAAAIFVPLVIAAGALAATRLLTGSPYQPPGTKHNSRAGMGIPVAGSVRLLALRVADLAGGPPWGIRVLRTTRGYECLQTGRVVNGQLGVLGQDGIFGNDHRFHPTPPNTFAAYDCGSLGTSGYALIGNWSTIHASGLVEIGTCAYPGPQGSGPRLPVCPAGDLRLLAYGLLGPKARAITYTQGGQHKTISTSEPQGAYLLVRRTRRIASFHGRGAGGTGSIDGGGPASFPGAVSILYHGGRVCPAQSPSGTDSCVYAGFRLPAIPRVHLRSVRVNRSVSILPTNPYGEGYLNIMLRFRAPVAVHNSELDYTVQATNPGLGGPTVSNLNQDVRKGAKIALGVMVPNWTRQAFIKLYLGRAASTTAPPHMGIPSPLATLATFKIDLPTGPHPPWCRRPSR